MILNDLMNTIISKFSTETRSSQRCTEGDGCFGYAQQPLRSATAMTTLFFNDGMGERKNLGNLENLGEIVVQDKKQIEFRSTETDSKRQILKKKL